MRDLMVVPRPRKGSRRHRSAMVYRSGPSSGGRRTPPTKRTRDAIDWDAVAEVLADPPVVPSAGGTALPVTGCCHDCGRRVSGERRFCGPCLARH